MKKIIFLLSALIVFSSVYAQDNNDLELSTDSLQEGNSWAQVAFKAIDKNDLLGGVSVVDLTEWLKKSYTLGSLELLPFVIGGFNGNIWGMDEYMVLIDGFPRDANNVLVTEIEQITLLKGAAASVLHGPKAVKGVIMITTKRGKANEFNFDIRANTGLRTPKSFPKYLGSAEYMTLYNEAKINDGLSPSWTEEDIYNYGSGINPYRYPNVDFYSSDYLRKMSTQSEAIVEVSGGSDKARFYTSTGFFSQGSLLKLANAKDNNVNRFFLRGNIDVKLHELLSANIDANATYYNAASAIGDYWGNAASLRPYIATGASAPLVPLSFIEENDVNTLGTVNASNYIIDGKYFLSGNQSTRTTAISDFYAAGKTTFVSRQFQFNGGVDFNMRNVVNGMFFRAKYGVDYASTYNLSYNNSYATYNIEWTNYAGRDMISKITKEGEDSKTGNQNISNNTYRSTTFFSGQFDYAKTINGNHNIFAMVVANGWQRQQNGVYHRYTNANLGVQMSYNYKQKYYADFSAAIPYSAKLPEENRIGFSPTGTLGWRLTKESFLSQSNLINDLVLSVSGGIIESDLDIRENAEDMGYYLYKGILTSGGWWSWGDLGGEAATEYQRGENPYLTYIKRKEFSIGLRGAMLGRKLQFDFNYFANKMDGGVVRATSIYPNYFVQTGYPSSSIVPFVNYNVDDRSGVDFNVNYNEKLGQVDLTLGVNGLYYESTANLRDESFAYDYQTRMGRPLNGLWGLENLGFFKDEADIAASPAQQFGEVKPGDIKYKDQNGDGIIDNEDAVYLNRWDDPLMIGVNLTTKWKNLTLFAMGNGYFGGYGFKNNSYWWVRGEGKYSEVVRNRWTEETQETATYPRLTTTSGDNNFRNSDFWMYNRNRINLTMVQVTYDLPERLFAGNFVKGVSAYLGGYNLLTIAQERDYMEMSIGSSPQTRFYNLGVKVQL